MSHQSPPLSRLAEDQPRIDGSEHHEHTCYECGASTRTERMDPIIRFNRATRETEYRFACADIGPCSMRKVAMGLTQLPEAGQ